jgi:acyl-CoA dehydrogenase
MADQSYLSWPVLEDKHRQLATDLRQWAGDNLNAIDHSNVDDAC